MHLIQCFAFTLSKARQQSFERTHRHSCFKAALTYLEAVFTHFKTLSSGNLQLNFTDANANKLSQKDAY